MRAERRRRLAKEAERAEVLGSRREPLAEEKARRRRREASSAEQCRWTAVVSTHALSVLRGSST